MNLDQVPVGQILRVKRVKALAQAAELTLQLEAIGFIAGEQVSVLRKNVFGGDPLMVRVGLSTFALRKTEAALIEVESP